MKYIDLIAYPLAMLVVYILIGFLNWDKDPANWEQAARGLWIIWGLIWGWAFQRRINRGGIAWE
jgi:hypothetical protein